MSSKKQESPSGSEVRPARRMPDYSPSTTKRNLITVIGLAVIVVAAGGVAMLRHHTQSSSSILAGHFTTSGKYATLLKQYASEKPVMLQQGSQVGGTFAPYGDQPSGGQGKPVDGIGAGAEQDVYHTHAHLSLYVKGKQAAVPAGIGIVGPWAGNPASFIDGGSALYWLHTHDNTGIIHIETPGQKNFTLGNFFDIWGVKLSSHQFQNVSLPVVAFVDGKQFIGNPRNIPLTRHEQITLELGNPVVVPQKYTFPPDLLKTETK